MGSINWAFGKKLSFFSINDDLSMAIFEDEKPERSKEHISLDEHYTGPGKKGPLTH